MNKVFLVIFFSMTALLSCKNETSKQNEVKLNVMSFNIRYDNPEDGENNWQYRKDVAAEIVHKYDIDLLGTQEVLVNQLIDLEERLSDYSSIGVGREDGIHQGEHSSIFYKKEKFEKIDSGDFWLSDTPDIVSVGWDAVLERIASWVKLKDKNTGIEFLFMNVHLDHVGKEARNNSIDLLLEKTKEYGDNLPVILTGDFNARPTSEIIQKMVNSENEYYLKDSRSIATVVEGAEGTFHDFKEEPNHPEGRIDYIFVNNKIEVSKYLSIDKKLNGIFLSDHVPIFAEIIIK